MKPTQKRIKALQKAEKGLLNLSTELQTAYFDAVWRSVSNSELTIENVSSNRAFMALWQRIVGRGISAYMKAELMGIEDISTEYYSQFTNPNLSFDIIQKKTVANLRRSLQNFSTAYNISNTVASAVQNLTISLIKQDFSSADVRKGLEAKLTSTDNALGLVDNFNLVQVRVQDQFSNYDRTLSAEYAQRLQLNYFIYQGGEIKTTRTFCEERAGGVFTKEEGIAFNSLDWDGKKAGNNFFVDCGGYNCRHFCDWISYELAKQLRPDIQKSVFDID